jgi:hypothetical protein
MASVFEKTVTKALPNGAGVFPRAGQWYARWKVKGTTRTVIQAPTLDSAVARERKCPCSCPDSTYGESRARR